MTKKIGWLDEIIRFVKFIGVGCVNVILDVLVYTICYQFLKLPPYQAQLMGVIFGLSSSYFLNRSFTFKSKEPFFGTQLFKFALVSLLCALLSSAAIDFLVNYMTDHTKVNAVLIPWIGKAIVTAAVGLFNFFLSRTVVFYSIRKRKVVRFCMNKIYAIIRKIRYSRKAQVIFIMSNSLAIDLCMYLYLAYVGLDSYKAQPLCVATALVCCYLLSLKFTPYRIEHSVGFFCISVIAVISCSPIMYLFEINFDLHALLAKIPATLVTALIVLFACRFFIYKDIFTEDK